MRIDKSPIFRKQLQASSVLLARVTRVFNDPADQDNANIFKKIYPGNSGIGAVEFEFITNINNLSRGYAKPLYTNQKLYPLINETIYLILGPTYTIPDNSNNRELYYISSFNAWNSSHINPLPITSNDEITNSSELNNEYGKTFNIKDNIRSLISFEGDHILEGRWGNSIRFGSTVTNSNTQSPWSLSGNNGDPIIIIRNGQTSVEDNENILVDFTLEDINRDASSIYMTNNQQISIDVAKKSLATFGLNYSNPPVFGIDPEAESIITPYNNTQPFPSSEI